MGYEQSKYMAMFDAYIDSEQIFFSNNSFNGLISMDKKNGRCNYITAFSGDVPWAKGMHKRIIKYKDRLFFFPNAAKGISVYNLNTNKMQFFKGDVGYWELTEIFAFGQVAYLIPKSMEQSLYLFDMEEYKFTEISGWNRNIQKTVHDCEQLQPNCACVIEKFFWTFIRNTNILIETSIITGESVFYHLDKDFTINYMVADGENLWISSKKKDIVIRWNKERGILEQIVLSDAREKSNPGDSNQLKCFQNRLLILPERGGEILIIDSDRRITSISIPDLRRVKDNTRKNLSLFGGCMIDNNDIYLLPYAADGLYILRLESKEITRQSLAFTNADYYYRNIALINNMWTMESPYVLERMEFYHEGAYQNILFDDFTYIIGKNLQESRSSIKNRTGCGCNIHDYIKQQTFV